MHIVAGKSLEHRDDADVEKTCAICGTACWIGPSQVELLDLLGDDSFEVVGDCCLVKVANAAAGVEVYASDEIVERVRRSAGRSIADGESRDGG